MPNPTISPLVANQPSYTITDSKDVWIDLYLISLDEGAEFTLVAPTTDTVTLVQGATSIVLTTAAGSQSVVVGGTTVSTNTTVAAGQSTLDVTITTGPDNYWRVTASGPIPNSRSITEGVNADIVRVVADPSVIVPGPVTALEKSNVNLTGTVSITQVVSGAPPAGLSAMPPLKGFWTQAAGAAAAAAGPTVLALPNATSSFTAPAVYGSTPLTYQLTAYYDIDNDDVPDAGEPVNSAQQVITIDPSNMHMLLVLDRSGSMASSLGTLSRWEAARRAAHVWADLFLAFRGGVGNGIVGVMVFEANTCCWGAASSPVDLLNPANHAVVTAAPLPSIDVNAFDLGSPGACTPIGDALVKAIDNFITYAGVNAQDRYVALLLTDGYENSGVVQVDDDIPLNPSVSATCPGASKYFAAARHDTPSRNTVNSSLTLYTIGVGGTVQEDVLDDLPNPPTVGAPPPGGFYRLVTQPEDVMPTFAQMLGDAIDAQTLPISFGATDATIEVDADENRLAIALQWDTPADDMRVSWRPQGGGVFTQVAGGGVVPPAGVTHRRRDQHGQTSVDLKQYFITTLGQGSVPATEWKVEFLPGGGAPAAIPPARLIAAIDLFLKAEILFDRKSYSTGDPMRITCRLRAGAAPVLSAQITAELARPGEGLGTFLATNSQGYQPPPPRTGAGDVPPPKQQMLQDLLRRKDWQSLPEIHPPSIFSDGSNQLFDDGAHQDGAANDGDYANVFTGTDKEGSYTWRFYVRGTLPDGSQYGRVLSMSRWVGVNVDPSTSPISLTFGQTGQRLQTATISVLPKDRRGELLGPFRPNLIQFRTSSGSFQGSLASNYDGTYSITLAYPAGVVPVVTVSVQGKDLPPVTVVEKKGCIGIIVAFIRKLLGLNP